MNHAGHNEHAAPAGGQERTPERRGISPHQALVGVVVLLVLACLLAIGGIIPRVRARKRLSAQTNTLAAPDVIASTPEKGKPRSEITLPGNISAFTDAPIYARTSGYLQRWYFDIGAHVKKGQLLATISSPEVDQQLLQARADLGTAEANAGLAKTNAARYQGLLAQNAVSKQDTDNFVSQAASTGSAVKSARANVQRLEELQSFEKIYAPFDGVITARNIDIGQLIDAGGGARELFHMAAVNTLRVYVNVPQVYSRGAVPGLKANLTFNEYPDQAFQGTLVRTARSIDPASRTLLVEIDVDNRNGKLVPGAYTEVHMNLNTGIATLTIPVTALSFRSEGLRVGTVVQGPNGDQAKLVPVTLGHDDGRTVEVLGGLEPDSQVIQDPPDSLVDGEAVHVMHPQGNGRSPE